MGYGAGGLGRTTATTAQATGISGPAPRRASDPSLGAFYTKLLQAVNRPLFRDGQWNLCKCTGWPDNPSYRNLVAWSWTKDDQRSLIVVNLSGVAVQARIRVPWDCRRGGWSLVDALSGASYARDGDEIQDLGLYVAMQRWGRHFFECSRKRTDTQKAAAGTIAKMSVDGRPYLC